MEARHVEASPGDDSARRQPAFTIANLPPLPPSIGLSGARLKSWRPCAGGLLSLALTKPVAATHSRSTNILMAELSRSAWHRRAADPHTQLVGADRLRS